MNSGIFGEIKVKDKKKDKKSYIFTRETLGMTIMLFSVIVFVMLLSGEAIFAGLGGAVCTFMYGTFGYGSWLVMFVLAYLGEWLTFEKKLKINVKRALAITLTVVALFLLFHTVTTRDFALTSYGDYITQCYISATGGYAGYTFGGVISSLIVCPVAMLSPVVCYILFSAIALLGAYLVFLTFRRRAASSEKSEKGAVKSVTVDEGNVQSQEAMQEGGFTVNEANEVVPVQQQPEPENNAYSRKNLGRKIIFEKGEFEAESYRRNMIFDENSYFNRPAALASEEDYLRSFTPDGAKPVKGNGGSYTENYGEEVANRPQQSTPTNYVYGEKPVSELDNYQSATQSVYTRNDEPDEDIYGESENYSGNVYEQRSTNTESARFIPEERADRAEERYNENIYEIDSRPEHTEYIQPNPQPESFVSPAASERNSVGFGENTRSSRVEETARPVVENESDEKESDDVYNLFGTSARGERNLGRRTNADLFDDEKEENDPETDVFGRSVRSVTSERSIESKPAQEFTRVERATQPAPAPQPAPEPEKPKHVWKKYVRPSLDLLDDYPENTNVNTGEIEDNKRIIVETLERFKIASHIKNVIVGPAITRYDVIIEDKTIIKRSLNYRDAIAMELRKDNVTAYLNYSEGALSIEVPNSKRTVVGLKTMLASRNFLNSKPGSLTFGLGKNVEGDVVCPDITKMPHLLVAGTTGSGKSICLSSLLISLLYKYGPEELRLILVDPKQVEFISYDKLPHLMINEILYECDKAIKALNWAIKEMERRYSLFKDMTEAGQATKNLDEYNAHLPQGEEKLPKILIVLDEFGDLMLQAKRDIESRIIKLVQKARACGIHLILATQRPSVDCITGLIKSNLPTRIGFKVNSFDDARTIFDIGGAEKLLGRGDMYFRSAENPDLARIQGCFVDTHEVQKVTDFIKANNETYFDQSVSDFINTVEQEEQNAPTIGGGEGGEESVETKIDDTFIKALKYCVTSNQASVSMIQRRFPVGYIKACKIIDWMENMNYVTQSEGSKPRKVLLSKDEFENIYGDDVDD